MNVVKEIKEKVFSNGKFNFKVNESIRLNFSCDSLYNNDDLTHEVPIVFCVQCIYNTYAFQHCESKPCIKRIHQVSIVDRR